METMALKRLFLLRHAKAEQPGETTDFERPLTAYGRETAAHLSQWLQAQDIQLDWVLCSPAARTRQTWTGLRDAVGLGAEVQYVPALYNAPESVLLEHIRHVPQSVRQMLVLAHSPGLEILAVKLTETDSPRYMQAQLHRHFPSGALAMFEFSSATWEGVAFGEGTLVSFVCPEDLV